MFEVVKNVLTVPFWATTAVIILWILIYSALSILKISEVNWKRLEYIWLFIGLLGIFNVVEENNKNFLRTDSYLTKQRINYNLSRIYYLLNDERACFKFVKLPSSPVDFDDRQSDQDLICSWAKKYRNKIDTINGVPSHLLDTVSIKRLRLKTSFMDDYVKDFSQTCFLINNDLTQYQKSSDEIKSSFWDDFKHVPGVLLLIIALAVKFSITTNNVKAAKRR